MALYETAAENFKEGKRQLETQSLKAAYPFFRLAYQIDEEEQGGERRGVIGAAPKADPEYASYYGLCLALEDYEIENGFKLCRWALAQDKTNGEFHFNLARVYYRAGDRGNCFKHIDRAERYGIPEQQLMDFLQSAGMRRRPVLPFLSRNNPLNKYLGILRHKMGENGA